MAEEAVGSRERAGPVVKGIEHEAQVRRREGGVGGVGGVGDGAGREAWVVWAMGALAPTMLFSSNHASSPSRTKAS